MRRLLIALPLLATACTVGPNYQRPATPGETGAWTRPADTAAVAEDPWRVLGDPVLDRLIAQAAVASPDVLEAAARLREARALRDAAAGRRLPEIDLTGSAQRQQVSRNGQLPVANIPGFDRNYPLFDVGFDASWEIDLWGGNRRAVESAARQQQATAARLADTRLQVAAEVVRTYAALRGAQASLASAREDAGAQAETSRLVKLRFEAGEAARFDDSRASSQARTTAAAIPTLEADARAAANSLAVLTGQPPEAMVALAATPAPLPTPPDSFGVGLRSDTLRRRADVRAAEADLAAATADVGVETARLFPKVSLVGGFGQQARKLGDLGSGDSTRFQFGPSLSWPILDFGRIRAQIGASNGRADQAAARYTKAVLTALSDSETALNRYAAARAELVDRQAALGGSAVSLDLARQRYRAGEDDLLAVLEAQSAFTAADRSAVQARRQLLESYASLIKALGA